ncbi:MAG: ATP-binding cassette domain-containing protein [Verrucomicrobia bacterium]|nr:ATP-binding cassette domain-containing protein [Verrucomicrobiota bacterium]
MDRFDVNLLGCMDSPTSGSLRLNGHELRELSERERTRFRREQIGFVFQHFGLVPTLTVAENVALPAFFARRRDPRRGAALLEKVGLTHRRDHCPHELSGGELQRAAIARVLVGFLFEASSKPPGARKFLLPQKALCRREALD